MPIEHASASRCELQNGQEAIAYSAGGTARRLFVMIAVGFKERSWATRSLSTAEYAVP